MRTRHLIPALAVILSCLPGCGPATGEVTGKVTFRGKPVTSGSIILYCPDKRIARGVIGPDGSYSVSDVPVGEAAVAVRSPLPPPAPGSEQDVPPPNGGRVPRVPSPGSESIPVRYGVPEESGLTVRVGRGRVVYNIELNP